MRSQFPGVVLLAVFAMVGARLAVAADAPRPNVLMIAVDDLNHWVGYLHRNPQTITPNIDRLAKRGVRFTRSYCAAPACNPSRAALMSGMRPSTTGVYENNDDWRPHIGPDLPLTATFREAGYFVAGAGKIYHGSYDRHEEWDDYFSAEGRDPSPKGDQGVGGIRFAPLECSDHDLREWRIVQYGIDKLNERHERPFLLTIGLHKPHMPWNVPRRYFDMHPLEDIRLPPHIKNDLADIPAAGIQMAKPDRDHRQMLESGRWKDAVQGYLAAVTYADTMIGRLLDALDASPYADNTIIMLWGDHGWHLGEKEHWRKFALWEESTRAPLIWVAPGVTKPDQVCERTVDFMSVYPTLCDLCGIPEPSHLDGKSIGTLLADPKSTWGTPAVTTYIEGNHAARSEGWRYIRYADGSEELYDETADPYEWTNLAARPEHAQRKVELAKFFPTSNAPDVSDAAGNKPARKAAKQERRKAKKELNR